MNAADTKFASDLLDPGIADVVIMLRNLGFNPTDSGDGVSKPDLERDFDVKHVACTFSPMNEDPAKAGEQEFFEEARRLHKVLGWGWKVEASFDPSAGGSYILLATKNEPPGPRHAAALAGFPFEANEWTASNPVVEARYKLLVERGRALYDALKHELGRR